MNVTLTDPDGGFVRDVELPDNLPVRPECVMLDGAPYALVLDSGKYRRMVGVWTTRSTAFEIPVAFRIPQPETFEIASSRWVTGCLASCKIRYRVEANLPWGQKQVQSFEETRPVVLNGVWAPVPESRDWNKPDTGEIARRLASEFCNKRRPRGSRLVATVLAMDVAGRMVVDIDRHDPANFFQKAPAQAVSMKRAMLESPAFVPAVWRMA